MPLAETIATGIERQSHLDLLTLNQRLRRSIAVAMGEIEDAEGNARCRAVRMDIDEPRAQIGGFGIAPQRQGDDRATEIVVILDQWRCLEGQRPGIVDTLIDRQFRIGLQGEPFARGRARVERRAQVDGMFRRMRDRIRARDPDEVEAERRGALGQRALERVRAQKSISA